MHSVVFLISNAVGFNLSVIDTHQRTGADDIVSTVYLECLKTCGTCRAVLHLVEEYERVAWFEYKGGVDKCQILYYAVYLVAVLEDSLVFLLQYKVDGNHMLVVVSSKL